MQDEYIPCRQCYYETRGYKDFSRYEKDVLCDKHEKQVSAAHGDELNPIQPAETYASKCAALMAENKRLEAELRSIDISSSFLTAVELGARARAALK